MIDFRYHLVSLVSVFIALAVGIVLGAGPLRGEIASTLQTSVDSLRTQKEQLEVERKTAEAGVRNRDAFAEAVLPTLVGQRLVGRSVVVLTLPGSDSAAGEGVTTTLQTAGAQVTGRVEIKDRWTASDAGATRQKLADQWRTSLLDSSPASFAAAANPSATPSRAVTSTPGKPSAPTSGKPSVPGPAGQDTSTAAAALGAELSRALVSPDPAIAASPDATGRALLDAFAEAGLIALDGDLAERATGVVVVAPSVEQATVAGALATSDASPTTDGSSAEQDDLAAWTALAVSLDRASAGVVVIGPASAATAGGVIDDVRSDKAAAGQVSTVDTGGAPMGDVAVVLALREQLDGAAGAYGFGKGATGPLPGQETS